MKELEGIKKILDDLFEPSPDGLTCHKCGTIHNVWKKESKTEWDDQRQKFTEYTKGQIVRCWTCDWRIEDLILDFQRLRILESRAKRQIGEEENESVYTEKVKKYQELYDSNQKAFARQLATYNFSGDELWEEIQCRLTQSTKKF